MSHALCVVEANGGINMITQVIRNKGKSLLIKSDNYTVVDIETTDLSIYNAEIIELSAIKVRNNIIVDKFTTLVRPQSCIPLNIVMLTGITNEMVQNAPTVDNVIQSFLDFIGDDILLGHNIYQYDLNILYDITYSLLHKQIKNDVIDTFKYAKHCDVDVPNYKLSTLAAYYNITNEQEHRSLYDCVTNHKIYQELKKSFKDRCDYQQAEPSDTRLFKSDAVIIDIDVKDKKVCVTGDFKNGTRREIESLLKNNGATITKTVSSSTDYLIIGEFGSINWQYGNYGNKTKKALELQKQGKSIKILNESEVFLKASVDDEKLNELLHTVEADCNITHYNMSSTNFKVKQLKDDKTKSITLGNVLVCKIKMLKNGYKVVLKKKLVEDYDKESANIKFDDNKNIAEIYFKNKSQDFYDIIEIALYDAVKTYQPENRFGCCSRYLDCSKMKKCLHPDLLYSKGCWYRQNIEKGIIFYK